MGAHRVEGTKICDIVLGLRFLQVEEMHLDITTSKDRVVIDVQREDFTLDKKEPQEEED